MRSTLLFFVFLFIGSSLAQNSISLKPIGGYETGIFNEGATEIAAYDAFSQRLFSVNADAKTVDVISLSNPANPRFLFAIDLSPYGKSANSVAVHSGLLAVAVENDDKQANGQAVFFKTSGSCAYVNSVEAGALPDMIIFSPDGRYALVANEGEPNDEYTVDPEGSVTVVKIMRRGRVLISATADFKAFNNRKDQLMGEGVRIFGPNASVAQDLEPEYITISPDSRTAWVACQENNALAIIDIRTATVTALKSFGLKNHALSGNELDASNKDKSINIANWPVYGMYQPDAITSYSSNGETFIISANEGDARDYDGFSEEERVKDLVLDETAFPNADELQESENLGRLKTTTTIGDLDGDGDVDKIFSYGARSFSIWNSSGDLVFDSGNELETITAGLNPDNFNSTDDENDSFDNRSDDKGPEPEGVVTGKVNGQTYAFIGLERVGGIMVYNVSNPAAPLFVEYVNTRDFSGDTEAGAAGDLSPEGLTFIPAIHSATGTALLVVSYEVSGSIRVFEISDANNNATNENIILAGGTSIFDNFPNPFNPATKIRFSIPQQGQVKLSVYDMLGKTVATLVNGELDAGTHEVAFDAGHLSSGVYFYRLQTGSQIKIKRMLLTK